MAKDLTVSQIERQNVLNNNWALPRIREALDVQAMEFEGKLYLTKQMVADFYEVSLSTVDRYLEQNAEELKHNGYVLCKGKALKEWKLQFGHLINDATKTTILGLFDFRSFLNMGMLLSESEKAKKVRSLRINLSIWCMGYVQDIILLTVTKGFRWWQELISCLRMAEVGRVSIF